MNQPQPEYSQAFDVRLRELEESRSAYQRALWHVVAEPEAAIRSLVPALRNKSSYAVVEALRELMRRYPADEAIGRLLDWVPVQCDLYPLVREALLRAGEHALPQIRERLARWADEGDDEAVRNVLDLGSGLPIEERIRMLPDWFRLLDDVQPDVRWSALLLGREFLLVSLLGTAESLPYPVVRDRIEVLARGDEAEHVRSEAAECLRGFPVPEALARHVPAGNCE